MPTVHRTLVANLERVWFFDRSGPDGPLELIGTTDNPAARLRTADFETDGPGQRHDRSGNGFSSHRTDRHEGPRERNAQSWAKAIAESLRASRARGTYDHLDLVVEPQLLGRIRNVMDDETSRLVERSVPKDVAAGKEHEVRAAIERLVTA